MCFASMLIVFTPRAMAAHWSRDVARLAGWRVGEQVVVLAPCAAVAGDQVLQCHQPSQSDAHLVLGPPEVFA
jgi:hypothetical protein